MNNSLKIKIVMIGFILFFMFFYMAAFGSKNAVIGVIIAMAAFMNLGNDLSYKPKLSFIKILSLLLILGIVAFFNNSITILGCVLTFIVVFGTTLTSYHLFATSVYLPFLMGYFMMMCIPVSFEDLPMRLLSLVIGAVFIVGLNLIVNRNKSYKLSKQTIDSLTSELNNAIDYKLAGKEVSKENFKTANGFYSNMFSQFEYRYFPSPTQESVLNVIKSFQYIGSIIADYDLSEEELEFIKNILSGIKEIRSVDIFEDINIKTREMSVVLLNFEYIIDEINNADFAKESILPDKRYIKTLIRPSIKRVFSFRSVKFTFAFKMAFTLTLWEILTLMFNLPFTKWLYFATIPLMLPYVNDMAYTAMTRLKGTFIGVFIFALIIIAMPYIPISSNSLMLAVLIICMVGMVYKLEDKLILTVFTTIMSVMTALMYITPDMAIELKLLWVCVAAVVVTAINYLFLPYSVEKETKNNLNARYKLNGESIGLIKENCHSTVSSKKTSLLVVSNILAENVEITDENRTLFELQGKITDICNFILTYMDKYPLSEDFKDNLVDIIDNGAMVNNKLDNKDKIILNSINYVNDLFKIEKNYFD